MGKHAAAVLWLLGAGKFAQSQPPAILQNGVFNAAGRMPLALPGTGLAPGGQILIEGVRVAPGPIYVRLEHGPAHAEFSARIESQEKTGLGLLRAVVPEDVPLGESVLRLVRGQGASAPFPATVVPSSFGIFSQNQQGWGPGEIYAEKAGRPTLNSPDSPATAGEALKLIGTGLGQAKAARVFVGGIASGESWIEKQPDGVEEITFTVPRQAPHGCYVPVWVGAAGTVSNVVTMSIASPGARCDLPALLPPDLSQVTNTYGFLVMMRSKMHLNAGGESMDFTDDEAAAAFLGHHSKAPRLSHVQVLPPPGTCTSYTGAFVPPISRSTSTLRDLLQERYSGLPVDSGPQVMVQGPKGTKRLPRLAPGRGWFGDRLGGESPAPNTQALPLFLEPGKYKVSSEGGRDVGSFETQLEIPRPVRWREGRGTPTITLREGAKIDLKGRDARQQVAILALNVDQISTAMAAAICMVPPGASSFTIPPEMLAHFPSTQSIPGLPLSVLLVLSVPHPIQPIQARGLDLGYAFYLHIDGRSVIYR